MLSRDTGLKRAEEQQSFSMLRIALVCLLVVRVFRLQLIDHIILLNIFASNIC